MPRWLQNAWQDFIKSADPDELVATSSPGAVLVGPGGMVATLLALAYIPPLARISELQNVGWSAACIALGSALTVLAWARRLRGTVAWIATLFDNSLYSAGLAIAAMSCREPVGMALGLAHCLMLALIPGRFYAWSTLFAVTMATPIAGLMVLLRPSLAVAIVLIASLVGMGTVMKITESRRRYLEQKRRLEQALTAADRLADESVQTALTTTLLTLGHFLHELRNYQTAIAVNLEFVAMQAELDAVFSSALGEAQEAQRHQAALLRETIESLRRKAQPESGTFWLTSALRAFAAERSHPAITVSADADFELRGNPEHLRVVLLNLVRNAEQAGARRVHCDVRVEPSGTAVFLMIHDDGPGIPENRREGLFQSFVTSTKVGGSGLGLYLVRRHVELLGGSIEVKPGPLGGAAFLIRLPGKASAPEPSSRSTLA